jgi:hypothetical protein
LRRVVEPAQQLGERGLARAVLAHDRERRARRDHEVEPVEDRALAAGIGEADAPEAHLARRQTAGRPRNRPRRRESPRRGHGGPEPSHGDDWRGAAVERPAHAAERDAAHPDGQLCEGDERADREPAGAGLERDRHEHRHARPADEQQAPRERPLAQACRAVDPLEEQRAPLDEACQHPVRDAEEPQLLGRGRVDREAIGVVGVALRLAHLLGVAVEPDGALAQQPVRRQPRAREHERRPPREGEERERAREAREQVDEAVGDEVHVDVHRRARHAEVEVARDGEVPGEARVLEVADPRRPHASGGETVVEPGRETAAEVCAQRLLDRAEHLEQHEDGARGRERRAQARAVHGRRDQHARREREERRQQAAQRERRPPRERERGGRPRQRREQLPFLSLAQPAQHRDLRGKT